MPPGLAEMHRQLLCPVCDCIFERPHVLPCQHAFCERCISNVLHVTRPSSHCITCKLPFFRRDVAMSPVLDGVVKAFKTAVASSQASPHA